MPLGLVVGFGGEYPAPTTLARRVKRVKEGVRFAPFLSDSTSSLRTWPAKRRGEVDDESRATGGPPARIAVVVAE